MLLKTKAFQGFMISGDCKSLGDRALNHFASDLNVWGNRERPERSACVTGQVVWIERAKAAGPARPADKA